MTSFQLLWVGNLVSWSLLGLAVRSLWLRRERHPELDLSRRAFAATRRVCDDAGALGPLFRPIPRAARNLLRRVSRAESRIREQREQAERGVLGLARSIVSQAFLGGDTAGLAHLRHSVEQLEALADALARYRRGLGELRDVAVPLQCVDAELDRRVA